MLQRSHELREVRHPALILVVAWNLWTHRKNNAQLGRVSFRSMCQSGLPWRWYKGSFPPAHVRSRTVLAEGTAYLGCNDTI